MTKAQRVRFKNRQKEYEAWGEVYAIVQCATNFSPRRHLENYSGLCHLLSTLCFGPFRTLPPHIYHTMRQRVLDQLWVQRNKKLNPYWLATPGARRPRLKWIEEIMAQVKAEAHGP